MELDRNTVLFSCVCRPLLQKKEADTHVSFHVFIIILVLAQFYQST